MAIVVIPARYGSRRLPGKPLLAETGRPLVVHVIEAARRATRVTRVLVATDDERILLAVREAGYEALPTSAEHRCGTERVAEVARSIPEETIFVNLQGDEPEIRPAEIDLLIETLLRSGAPMATLAAPLLDPKDLEDPAVVKVVIGATGDALYFSRAAIPFDRDGGGDAPRFRHVGIYGFTREALLAFAALPPGKIETAEKLEQLRAIENGMRIRVAVVASAPPGIDTLESYRSFVRRASAGGAELRENGDG